MHPVLTVPVRLRLRKDRSGYQGVQSIRLIGAVNEEGVIWFFAILDGIFCRIAEANLERCSEDYSAMPEYE